MRLRAGSIIHTTRVSFVVTGQRHAALSYFSMSACVSQVRNTWTMGVSLV